MSVFTDLIAQLEKIKVEGAQAEQQLERVKALTRATDTITSTNPSFISEISGKRRQLGAIGALTEVIEPYQGVNKTTKNNLAIEAAWQARELEAMAMAEHLKKLVTTINQTVDKTVDALSVEYNKSIRKIGENPADLPNGQYIVYPNTGKRNLTLNPQSAVAPQTTVPHEFFHYFEDQIRKLEYIKPGMGNQKPPELHEGQVSWKSYNNSGAYSQLVREIEKIVPQVAQEVYMDRYNKGLGDFEAAAQSQYRSQPHEIFARNAASLYTTGKTENPELQQAMEAVFAEWKVKWPRFFQTLDAAQKELELMKTAFRQVAPENKKLASGRLPYERKAYTDVIDISYDQGENTAIQPTKRTRKAKNPLLTYREPEEIILETQRYEQDLQAAKAGEGLAKGLGPEDQKKVVRALNSWLGKLDKEYQKSIDFFNTEEKALEQAKQLKRKSTIGVQPKTEPRPVEEIQKELEYVESLKTKGGETENIDRILGRKQQELLEEYNQSFAYTAQKNAEEKKQAAVAKRTTKAMEQAATDAEQAPKVKVDTKYATKPVTTNEVPKDVVDDSIKASKKKTAASAEKAAKAEEQLADEVNETVSSARKVKEKITAESVAVPQKVISTRTPEQEQTLQNLKSERDAITGTLWGEQGSNLSSEEKEKLKTRFAEINNEIDKLLTSTKKEAVNAEQAAQSQAEVATKTKRRAKVETVAEGQKQLAERLQKAAEEGNALPVVTANAVTSANTVVSAEEELAVNTKKAADSSKKLASATEKAAKKVEESVPTAAPGGGGGKPPIPPTTPPVVPPTDEDPFEKLKRLLRQGARGNVAGADIEGTARQLTEGRELTSRMRLGGGAYLTRDKEITSEIDAVVNQLRELSGTIAQTNVSAKKEAEGTAKAATLQENINKGLEETAEVIQQELPNQRTPGEEAFRRKATGKMTEEEKLAEERQAAMAKDTRYKFVESVPSYPKLSKENQESLTKLLGTTETESVELQKLEQRVVYTTERAAKGFHEVTREILNANVAANEFGQTIQKTSAFVNTKTGQVLNKEQYQEVVNPNLRALSTQYPTLRGNIGTENYSNLLGILDRAKTAAGLGPLAAEIKTTETNMQQLSDGWVAFTRVVTNANGAISTSTAFLNEEGKAFDTDAFKAEQARIALEKVNKQQAEFLKNQPNAAGVSKYFAKRGLPLGGETEQGQQVQTTITQMPQKYGGDIIRINAKALDQQNKIMREATVYTNQFGDVITAAHHRVQNFTESIVHNVSELFRWSIGIGLLYGGMYRLQQAFQQTIQNEALLADVTVTLGMAQRNVNEIFNDAAKVARNTGESITEVLQTYKMAYTAVGGVADPIERTAAANKLLYDSTVLNKLSGLEAAAAIDTLSGALRQTALNGETAAQSFDRGSVMLDKWVRLSNKANVDLSTLAQAFSITAESAMDTGMSIEELNAVIATLSEKIGGLGGKETGNAVRALIGGVYQDQAAKALNQYGIAVTDATGKMRSFMEISRDIYMMYKNGLISRDEITKLAYTLGGGVRRGQQYLAYLTDYERIQENIAVQNDVAGASQLALARKMDTTQTSITQMNNAFMGLTQTLGSDGGVLDIMTALLTVGTKLADIFNTITKHLGSLTIPITLLSAIAAISKFGGTPGQMRINSFTDMLGKPLGGLLSYPAMGLNKLGLPIAEKMKIPEGMDTRLGIKTFLQSALGGIAMGTILGSIPAMTRFNEGGTAGKVGGGIDVAGAIVGSIVGALAGPQGAMIGGVVGGAIADAFIASALTHKTDLQDIFEWEKVPEKVKEGEKAKPTTEEEFNKQLYSGIGFGSEWLGRIRANWAQRASALSFGGTVTPERGYMNYGQTRELTQEQWAAIIYAQQRGTNQYANLKQTATGIPIEAQALPKMETTQYTFYDLQKQVSDDLKSTFDALTETARNEMRKQLASKEIKPTEFRTGIEASYSASTAAITTIATINDELSKQVGINKELKLTEEDVLEMYLKGTPEAIGQVNQLTNEIVDYMNQLDELAKQPAGQKIVPTWGGEAIPKEQLQPQLELKIKDNKDQILLYVDSIVKDIQDQEAAKIKIAPYIDVSKMNITVAQLNDAFKEAMEKERAQWEFQVKMKQLTPEQYQQLVNQAEANKTFVWLGGQIGGWMKQGLLESNFLQDALNEQAANVNIPFEFMDYSPQQIQSAANSPMYYAILNAIKAAGGNAEEEKKVVVSSGDPTNPLLMSKNWAIVQYLLSQILKTEEKQLEGIYNLPGGASFYVPFDAYKMGYANKGAGGGGGLDIPTVKENTSETSMNTQALKSLTEKVTDILVNGVGTTQQKEQQAELKMAQMENVYGNVSPEDEGRFMQATEVAWRRSMGTVFPSGWENQLDPNSPSLKNKPATTPITPETIITKPTITPTTDWSKFITPWNNPQQTPAVNMTPLQKILEDLKNAINGLFTPKGENVGKDLFPAQTMGGFGLEGILNMLAGLLSNNLNPQPEPTMAAVRKQDTFAPAYATTELGGDATEGLLSSINSGIQAMVDLMRIQNVKQTQPGGLLDKGNQGGGGGGNVPQVSVSIQPQPIKVDFSTTTVLTVDGAVLASVIMPYVYAALVRYNGSQGGATRSYTSI